MKFIIMYAVIGKHSIYITLKLLLLWLIIYSFYPFVSVGLFYVYINVFYFQNIFTFHIYIWFYIK